MNDNGWDVIVVGAGSAGAVVASRRSEDPACRVLVLEAGPDYRSADSPPEMQRGHWSAILDLERFPHYQWPSLTARRRRPRNPEPYWRGRGVGGSSAINGMVAIRPPLDDFDQWRERGGALWSRDAVLERFAALEDDVAFGDVPGHGRGGPIPISRAPLDEWSHLDLAFRDACLRDGQPWMLDSNADGSTGISTLAYNARDEVRVSTNDAYLEPARSRANLTVLGNVLVDRVRFDGTRAIGVRAIVDGAPREFGASEVVLASGAVHSPAILLRSGIGPADELRELGITALADLPVGHNLQEHPSVAFVFPVDVTRPGPHNGRHTNAIVRWHSDIARAGANDMAAIMLGPAPAMPSLGGIGFWVNQPFSRGVLRLASTDPTIDPDIDLCLADDPADRQRLAGCIERAHTWLRGSELASLIRGPITGVDGTTLDSLLAGDDVDRWIDRTVDVSAHPSCTCAMGEVVDGHGRVFGTENLRVIDLSITPSVPRANTGLTAIMIGEHLGR